MERYKQLFNESSIYLHPKSMVVSPKTVNLSREYANLNRKLFDNELPSIPLRWGKMKNQIGKVTVTGSNDPETWKIKDLVMTTTYERTYEQFISDLAHEMIHVWSAHRKQPLMGGYHGIYFKAKMKELNSKFGLDITTSESI